MVFKSLTLFARNRGPDDFWRKRRIFKMSAHFRGRRRNCYSIAVRYVHRALVYATKGRDLKRRDMASLWEARLEAACEQHETTLPALQESLSRLEVGLSRKALAELAAWEPRSFAGIARLAAPRGLDSQPHEGVFTRHAIKPHDT